MNILAYYVIGSGVRAAVMMDNVAAVNGIVHYIDRVLGVPYQSLYEIMRNESKLQYDNFTSLKYHARLVKKVLFELDFLCRIIQIVSD